MKKVLSYQARNGKTMKSFIIEVSFKDKNKAEHKKDITLEFKTKGAKTKYPARFKVLEEIKNNKVVPLSIKKEDDKVVVYYEDVPAGVVDENDENYMDLFNIIPEEGMRADAFKVEGTTFFIKVSIPKATLDVVKTISDFDEIFNRIEKEGIDTLDNLQRKYQYLVENDVEKEDIIQIFNTYKKYPTNIETKIPKNPEVLFKDYFGAVKKAIVYLNEGENLRFEGDKGSGKNCLITTLAWLYNRPLYEISMNVETDRTDLQGSKTLEVDENGHTKVVFDKSAVIEAVEVGGFLNLDEVNTVRPEVLVWLHSLTDKRRSVSVSGYGKVVAHEDFRIILTMNKDYQGTFTLNEATNDRFVPIIFPMPQSIQELLATIFPNINPSYIQTCQKVYSAIRKAVLDGELSSSVITIRGFETTCKVAKRIGLKEALIDNIANRAVDEFERKVIIEMIDTIMG